MPSTPSAIPAFLDALRAALMARPGLAGVGVFTAHPGDEIPPEALVVDRVTSEQSWAALGRLKRDEQFTTFVVCHIAKPGAGEDVAKQARERAYALTTELADALRADPGVAGTVRVAAYVRDELRQGTGNGSRWAQVEVQIESQQRI